MCVIIKYPDWFYAFMGGCVLFAIAAGFLSALWARTRSGGRNRTRAPVFFRAERLLVNPSERQAWDLLQRANLGHTHVFAKVRLEDVVSAHSTDWRSRMSGRGRIKSRHLDFVLTDADFQPMLAIEVDGASHQTERAAIADAHKNRILASAGLPLLRLRVGEVWQWQDILLDWRRKQAPRAGMMRQ